MRACVVWLPVLAVLAGLTAVAPFSTAVTPEAPAASKAAPTESEPADNEEAGEDDGEPMLDPLGPNAACYVCHTTFVFEEMARVHLAEKITCIECHGLSAAHANDENVGATKPDITFARGKVDASCIKCHENHDVPAHEVVARFVERELEDPKPICTDCHGMHRIEEADTELETEETAPMPAEETAEVRTPNA